MTTPSGEAASDIAGLKTIDQVIRRADETTDPRWLTWAGAGAGRGLARDRNADALRRIALIPEVLEEVGEVSPATTVAGVELDIPVFASPIGSTTLFHPEGAVAVAAAAARAGTTAFCGFTCEQPWAEVAAVSPGRQFFQLYVLGDEAWLEKVVARVEKAGFAGICLTADSARVSRRDELIESGADWNLEREGLTVNLADLGRDESWRARFGWEDLRRLCAATRLPVVVKGILSPRSAVRAVESGAAAVYVSNHGGRALEQVPATIDVLPDIVREVAGEVDVLIDGGFSRGVEVLAAVALGARAVGLGRLHLRGIAVGGADGLTRVFEILRSEIEIGLALLGARSLAELTPEHVRRVPDLSS